MEHGHPNLTRGPFWEGRGVAVGGGGGNQPKKQGKSGKMGMKMGGNREEKGNLGKLAPAVRTGIRLATPLGLALNPD